MSGRGGRVPRPPVGEQWDLRFTSKGDVAAWDELCRKAPGNCAEMHDRLTADPRQARNPARHHRLKGSLAVGRHGGDTLEQWQYEVTGAGRVWFLIDDRRRRVLLTKIAIGHPSETS